VWRPLIGSSSPRPGLRPALIRASRLLPPTPHLFHNLERHFLGDRLSQILATNQRTLSQVENNDILPTNTLFYGTAIPAPNVPCFSDAAREAQTRLRAAWFEEGFKNLSEAELVFLDPDNGMAAKRAKKHWRGSVKYVFEDEVTDWLNRGQSVVLYQHQQRRRLPRSEARGDQGRQERHMGSRTGSV
jgi:hypothetical protein